MVAYVYLNVSDREIIFSSKFLIMYFLLLFLFLQIYLKLDVNIVLLIVFVWFSEAVIFRLRNLVFS